MHKLFVNSILIAFLASILSCTHKETNQKKMDKTAQWMKNTLVSRDSSGFYHIKQNEQVGIKIFVKNTPFDTNKQEVSGNGSSQEITLGPYPQQRKYFLIQIPDLRPTLVSEHQISLEKVSNMRDLGGLVTTDNHIIMPGRIIRTGNPGFATDKDIEYLKSIHPDAIVDFRTEMEKNPAEQKFGKSFNWIADPVNAGNLTGSSINDLLKTATANSLENMMIKTYQDFPVLYQSQFKKVLELAEQNKTFFYHCTAGKDRTGFATLLLLTALGVDKETIFKDYLESNEASKQLTETMAKMSNSSVSIDPDIIKPLLEVKRSYLQAALDVIDEKYGGIDNYLKNILKVDVKKIRSNYLQ